MVQPPQVFFFAVGERAGGGYGLDDRGGRDDLSRPCFRMRSRQIHVVAMNVREQNQIGLRQAVRQRVGGSTHL